jgi:cobalt transporter subunit CbtA
VFRRMFYSALLAGILAGVLLTLIQEVTVKPLIAQAEVLEGLAEAAHVHAEGHQHSHEHDHAEEARDWSEPSEDAQVRLFYTAISNFLVGTGYALLLAACFSQMQKVNWRIGMLWGTAGFIVFQLAPSLGLPPELPGAPHAALELRQAWWLSTVLTTASGLWLLWQGAKRHKTVMLVIGGLLLALPHLVGAPSGTFAGAPPEALSQQFIVMVLFTAAAFWIILGSSLGYIYDRLTRSLHP